MRARNIGRYLAPITLLATIAATLLVVLGGLKTHHHPNASASTTGSVLLARPAHHRSRVKFYVVRSGDTLSSISFKSGVSVATLEALNPGASPSALQTGQRLRLRR